MKRLGALILVLTLIFTACGKGEKDKEEKKDPELSGIQAIDKQFAGKTLKITSFTKDMEFAAKAFEQAYSCKVELIVKDKENWAVDPVSMKAEDKADIYTIEAVDMEKWLNGKLLSDLTDVSAENYVPYTIAYATDNAGSLKALTWSVTPINLYYRRTIAKKILGEDSPETVATALANIQSALDFSAKLQAEGYKLFPNYQDMRCFYQAEDKTAREVLSPIEQGFLTSVRQMETDYRLAGLETWSKDWFKGMYGKATNTVTGKNIEIFGYVLPSWAKSYVLEKAGDDTENSSEQNPTWGDWGVTSCPTSDFSEGIWLGIDKDSKQADMAKAFLIYVTQNQEFLDKWLAKTKEIPAFIPIMEHYAETKTDSFLGDQKAMALYLKTVKAIPAKSAVQIRQEKEYYNILEEFIKGNIATFEELQTKLAQPVESVGQAVTEQGKPASDGAGEKAK